jgi:hypothetical protein
MRSEVLDQEEKSENGKKRSTKNVEFEDERI